MLNALRRGAKGVFAKILIAVLVLSFAVWGVADFVNQVDPNEVARVGDTPVTAAEFDRAWRLQSARFAQQLGRSLTPDEARAIGLPQGVLQGLVTEALQVDAARDLGIDVSDEALAERIRTSERFAPGGQFDRTAFDRFLADFNYGEAEFIELQRDATVQDLWVNSLVGGVTAPTAYLEAMNRYANQTRQVATFTLTDDALGTIEDPSEDELRAYYEANQDRFRAPERRTFSTVTLSPEALAEPDAVSAEAVRRAYETEGAYGGVERRRVQQVILEDGALAQRAADAVNDGTAFAVILRELDRKFADVDLGLVEEGDIVDDAVAEAAFALEPRRATVVDGRFGPTLVRVSEVEPAAKQPFEAVEDEIRLSLALDEAVSQVRALSDSVIDAIAGGAPVAEVGERFDLPVRTVEAVDRNGVAASGDAAEPLPSQGVLDAAFAAAAGDDAVPVEEGGASTTWVQTDTVIEAAVRPFEDVAGDVLLAWTEAQQAERLAALAAEAGEAIRSGTPMADVAARYGTGATTSEPFTESAPPQGMADAVAAEAFAGPLGHVAAVRGPGIAQVVVEVVDVSEPAFFEDAAEVAPIQRQLNDGIANALLYDLLTAHQAEVGATVNQPIVDRVIGVGSGRG